MPFGAARRRGAAVRTSKKECGPEIQQLAFKGQQIMPYLSDARARVPATCFQGSTVHIMSGARACIQQLACVGQLVHLMPACVHTCTHTYTHAHIHTHMHTYIHTYIHPCIPTYISRTTPSSAPRRQVQPARSRIRPGAPTPAKLPAVGLASGIDEGCSCALSHVSCRLASASRHVLAHLLGARLF